MRIAIIGGTGFIGAKIVAEALKRGHQVVSISRTTISSKQKGLVSKQFTIFDEKKLEDAIKDCDVVVSAYHPGYFHVDIYNRFLDGYDVITKVVKSLDKKLVMVLGTSSLKLSDGSDFEDEIAFSGAWKDTLEGTKAVYEKYVNDNSFKWTMVSPAAEVVDIGKRGNYRVGTDYLIVNSANVSRISSDDLADAILNEIEGPQFLNKRFTVGYSN